MAEGKSFYAYSVSPLYHPEPLIFLRRLSTALERNIKACFFDIQENTPDEVIMIENGYKEVLTIYLNKDRNDDNTYEVEFPIAHDEKEFNIVFYPNGIITMMHIPFTQSWQFFIETILDKAGKYYGGRAAYLAKMNEVRFLYKTVFETLKCEKAFISPSISSHHWVLLFLDETSYHSKIDFNQILLEAQDKDHIRIFNLQEALNGEHDSTISEMYQKQQYHEIAFVDAF